MHDRFVIITQAVDANDDHRASFIDWIRAFSHQYREVTVIAGRVGAHDLPSNVRIYSLGKEQGVGSVMRAVRFFRYLVKAVPGSRGIFAYASPIFVIAAWPIAAVFRRPIVFWYLHRKTTLRLRLALLLCHRLVTADAASLTIKSPKIVAIGHGIAAERFAFPGRTFDMAGRPLHLVSVGRLAPIKDLATLIRAAGLLVRRNRDVAVRIVGQANRPEHHHEEKRLRDLVAELGLEGVVKFVGFVPYRELPAQYQWADAVIGCTPRGGIDKAMLEGMAAGCVPFTSNDVMRTHLDGYADSLLFPYHDASVLAERLAAFYEWAACSAALVALVREHHSLLQATARIGALI